MASRPSRRPRRGARPSGAAGRRPSSGGARPPGRKGGAGRAGPDEPQRLQKVLAQAGLGSRRETEEWIRAGRITVNGEVAVLGTRALATDKVRLDGRLIRQRAPAAGGKVFLCHRSPGESLHSPEGPEEDPAAQAHSPGRSALIDRLPRRAGRRFIAISPMPRVDGGLELVTSDGELAVLLQRRVHLLASGFSVRVRGELTEPQREGVLSGQLDSGEQLQVESCEEGGGEGANRWYVLVARGASGKDVRQLFERQGALVSRVLRTHMGSLTLERSLGRGAFRELTSGELESLTSTDGGELRS
jgi:23S rRNA pseudouridine2605 synthase